MSKEQECNECGEYIVFVQDDYGNWIPVDADTYTEGERYFDENEHTRHSC